VRERGEAQEATHGVVGQVEVYDLGTGSQVSPVSAGNTAPAHGG
jgi:hypothetical protein